MTRVPARPPAGRIVGVVREWHPDDGWGVIESVATPGGCWAHYSAVQMPGYRFLSPGQAVTLFYERADQDGYAFRATRVVVGDAVRGELSSQDPDNASSDAYRSALHLTFDDETPR